ncbi:MAG TPA: molybdopterin biosynthesis protein, partial [Anaerolineaceae bacterium]|nr:molybdopterin biosynthesis protein [Anaerolineaceae bacterium]
MPYQYLTNLPLEDAREKFIAALIERGLTRDQQTIATVDALNRISAEAIYARISAPHYNACAMDGVALDSRLTFGASERTP